MRTLELVILRGERRAFDHMCFKRCPLCMMGTVLATKGLPCKDIPEKDQCIWVFIPLPKFALLKIFL